MFCIGSVFFANVKNEDTESLSPKQNYERKIFLVGFASHFLDVVHQICTQNLESYRYRYTNRKLSLLTRYTTL